MAAQPDQLSHAMKTALYDPLPDDQREEALACYERDAEHALEWYFQAETLPAKLARLRHVHEAVTRLERAVPRLA